MHAIAIKRRLGFLLLLPSLFICFLLLPTLDWCFHLDRAPATNEKRQPASFPEYKGLFQIKQFLAGLDSYYNDHFGYRKRLIRTSNHWKRQLFAEGSLNDVTIGRDGWLYISGDRMIENYTGITSFKEQELKDWQLVLETRRDWLAKLGSQYVFVIPPEKQSVYPEYLPSWLVRGKYPGKLDQFFDYMRVHSTVRILDLRPCLLEAKKVMPTYLMTDTHWNRYGGFVAYQTLINALSNVFPDLAPLPLSAFSFEILTNRPTGDLATLLGESSMREECEISFKPKPPLAILEPPLRDDSRLPKKWRKEANPAITLNPNATRKAVLFRDSYSCSWYSFLGQHFHEVLYIWQYDFDRAFLLREKPDVVVSEITERFFNKEDPAKLLEKDNLNAEFDKIAPPNP